MGEFLENPNDYNLRKWQRSPFLYLPYLHWFKEARNFFSFITQKPWEVEHLDPISNGGLNDVHNLGVVPAWINQRKGNIVLKGAELTAYLATEVPIANYVARLGELYGWEFMDKASMWGQRLQGFPQPPGVTMSSQPLIPDILHNFWLAGKSLFLHVSQFLGAVPHSLSAGLSAIAHHALPALGGLVHQALPMLLHLALL